MCKYDTPRTLSSSNREQQILFVFSANHICPFFLSEVWLVKCVCVCVSSGFNPVCCCHCLLTARLPIVSYPAHCVCRNKAAALLSRELPASNSEVLSEVSLFPSWPPLAVSHPCIFLCSHLLSCSVCVFLL